MCFRRRFLFCSLALACFAGTSSALEAGEKPQRKPNIIVLLADDLGYADLGIHGGKEVATPHIDSLAKNGVRCTSGYVSAPYCSPTRAGLLTGRYQEKFGHEFNPVRLDFGGKGQGLAVGVPTIADLLRAAGYATGLVGKWHLGEEPQFHPQARGFSDFFGFLQGSHSYFEARDKNINPILRGKEPAKLDGYLTGVLANEANGFIQRNKDRPFFLYLAFNAVHTPMHAPEATLKRISGVQDEKRKTYLAMLAELDEAVGKVLSKLRELKLEEDTLIIFLSDNGGPTTKFAVNGSRNFPLRGSKGDTWEGGIRVPFLVQWKGRLPAGKVYDHPVISLDILPTALNLAGLETKAEWKLDGVNLMPFLSGKDKAAPHEALYWRFGTQMAIRKGDWVLVRPSLGKGEYENVSKKAMLFNVTKDIGQQNDLAGQHPELVRELQTAWDRWNSTLMSPRWPATKGGKVVEMP